jgi:predicted dehydrogenase
VFHSRSEESARRLNRQVRGAGVFRDLDEVLAQRDLDAVLIATPPAVHSDQVCRALAAGKSVLVEKPLCLSREELAAITRHQQPGRVLMVAENYLYKPLVGRLRQLLPELGAIRLIELRKERKVAVTGWRRAHGALLEGGIHFVALLNELLAAAGAGTPREMRAEFPGAPADGLERRSVIWLRTERGVEARLRYAWDRFSPTAGLFQHSSIVGARGRVVFESNGLYLRTVSPTASRTEVPGLRDLGGYGAMIDDFLSCLEDPARRTPRSDLAHAARDLELVLRAYESLPGRASGGSPGSSARP